MPKTIQQKSGFSRMIAAWCVLFCVISFSVNAAALPAKVVCKVETERDVYLAGGPQQVVLKVTLDAPPAPESIRRPSVNIALVLDQSGSMNGTKIKQAKAAAIEA